MQGDLDDNSEHEWTGKPGPQTNYLVPDVVPDGLPGLAGVTGDGVLFFGWSGDVLPADPLAEPLALPDGLAVPPLPAGRSQPDRTPARASAKTIDRIRFMGVAPFRSPY